MKKSNLDQTVFKGTTVADLMEEATVNYRRKSQDINDMLNELRVLIQTPADAMLIVPLISEFLGRGIENDSQLIKIISIVQRVMSKQVIDTTSDVMFTDDELVQLQNLTRKIEEFPENKKTIPLEIIATKIKSDPESEQ